MRKTRMTEGAWFYAMSCAFTRFYRAATPVNMPPRQDAVSTKTESTMKRLSIAGAALALAAHALPACAQTAPVTVALPDAQLQKLLAAYALVKHEYVGQVDDDKLFDGALAGMLGALDAHSQYLNKDDMREIDREHSGEYVGIGIGIEVDHERMRIQTVSAGSPAERAGILPGDVVTAIDGVDATGLTGQEVSRRMHGAPDTQLTLGLIRQGSARTVTLARAALRDDTVKVAQAAPGMASIRIEEFGGTTGAELAAALKKLDGAGAPRGLVLDLRNNPGGMLPAAVAVAGAFLPEHAVVFTARGRQPAPEQTVTVDGRYYRHADEPDVLAGLPAWTRTVPLTVLVNGASASAAELVAGALQDHGRATLVGSRTFGKGSIQSVIPLDADSGVKFTVARYFTPNGHEIQAHGVVPDVAVAPPASAATAYLPREGNLANHLPPENGTPAVAARSQPESTSGFGGRDDGALKAALALLAPPKDEQTGKAATLVARLRQWGVARTGLAGAP
jgi:carboxyl-terminal processing protease